MSRPAASVLVAFALLGPVSAASAAGSHLTPNPPAALASPAAPATPGDASATASGSLPRTGTDLPLEAVLGVLLLAAGAGGRSVGRSRG